MAAAGEPAVCGACGRVLPAQQGKGRKRRYCDDRCRDAARRARARSDDSNGEIVKKELTQVSRQDYLYSMPDVPTASDSAAAPVGEPAQRLLHERAEPDAGSPLDTVAAARELSAAAAGAMQAAVDRARD